MYMVEHIERLGVRDERVLAAMRKVERHRFVPNHLRSSAYDDSPLPIGEGQTISQPYIVAYMTEALGLQPSDKVLEIGTGSGYQAAILAELAGQVYSMEIVEPLGRKAADLLASLGYRNLEVRIGNGWQGWREHAPFDAIIVTAAPQTVPQALLDQLADGGRMILPIGYGTQQLTLITKDQGQISARELLPVIFVPMTGGDEREGGAG